MTDHIQIGDVSPRVRFIANGVDTEFPFGFPIFKDADLKVYVDGCRTRNRLYRDRRRAIRRRFGDIRHGARRSGSRGAVTAPGDRADHGFPGIGRVPCQGDQRRTRLSDGGVATDWRRRGARNGARSDRFHRFDHLAGEGRSRRKVPGLRCRGPWPWRLPETARYRYRRRWRPWFSRIRCLPRATRWDSARPRPGISVCPKAT